MAFCAEAPHSTKSSRRAIPALHRIAFDEGFLNGMEARGIRKALNGQDLLARDRAHRCDARTRCGSIDENRTRAALSFSAAVLGSREVEVIPKYVQKRRVRFHTYPMGPAVHEKIHASILVPFRRGVVELMEAHEHPFRTGGISPSWLLRRWRPEKRRHPRHLAAL